jgi:AcrR family transcriptional regulator
MCPAPARTSDAAIIAAARLLLERNGPDGVTMQAVGAAVGVRGPSLYKRFADRAALLRAVEEAALGELRGRLQTAAAGPPREALRRMAIVYRDFAHAAPPVYALLFAPEGWDEARVAARQLSVAPLLAVTAELAGAGHALPAARLLTAFMHGWVSMELAGAFRLGGDIEAAFEYSLSMLIEAIAGVPPITAP